MLVRRLECVRLAAALDARGAHRWTLFTESLRAQVNHSSQQVFCHAPNAGCFSWLVRHLECVRLGAALDVREAHR